MPSTPGTLNFPGTLDDAVSLIQYANNASATLTSGINNSVLLIPVSAPSEFSNSGVVTIVDSLINPTVIEIVLYTSKSGSDLVVPAGGRGAQGTAASSFSAGAVVEQRPTARGFTVLADAVIAIEQKIGDGSPLHPLDASGSNQAGADYDIHGGKGTGNAEPGAAALRYPLRGASGSTPQSLSTDRFPIPTNLFTNTNAGSAVANTTTETSLLTNVPASSGSTRTIEAGITKQGAVYRIHVEGFFGTTGTPTIQFKFKLGSTLVADSTAFTTPNNSNGVWSIDVDFLIYAIGASGQVRAHLNGDLTPGSSGAQTPVVFRGTGQPTIDFTANQTIDLTVQWGTANASNTITVTGLSISRIR